MKLKHSPFPWVTLKPGFNLSAAITIYDRNVVPVMTTCSNGSPDTMSKHRAGMVAGDVRLIESIPAMLVALQQIAEGRTDAQAVAQHVLDGIEHGTGGGNG